MAVTFLINEVLLKFNSLQRALLPNAINIIYSYSFGFDFNLKSMEFLPHILL